jgi:hypothetical protein
MAVLASISCPQEPISGSYSVHTLRAILSRSISIVSSHYPSLLKVLIALRILTKILHAFLTSPMLATGLTHLTLHDFASLCI